MKTAIYIEDGTIQLVITPESDFEKDAMRTFGDGPIQAKMFRGTFYDCRGGMGAPVRVLCASLRPLRRQRRPLADSPHVECRREGTIMSNASKGCLWRLCRWWNHRLARRLAKKQGLDFFHGVVFDHQLPFGVLTHGKIVEVTMSSGRTALYKALCVDRWNMGGAGQHDWQFEFQGYAPNMESHRPSEPEANEGSVG